MNKQEFITTLEERLSCDHAMASKINEILEETFFIGWKNKEKMIEKLMSEFSITDSEANHIYEVSMAILGSRLKDKLKHPFKDLDQK